MVFVFAMILVQRHRILAQWWVHQLKETADPKEQSYYAACLASIGDDGAGAIEKLGQDPRSEIRALVIPASQGLSAGRRFALLRVRLGDMDYDVRLSAATALAFLDSDSTHSFLLGQMNSPAPEIVMAAAAGLARVHTPDAVAALCDVASGHLNAWVRAQAVESLGQHLAGDPMVGSTSRPADDENVCDPVSALVNALSDQGRFSKQLALETEIDAVAQVLTASKGIPAEPAASQPTDGRHTVAEVAAFTLSSLTGHAIAPQAQATAEEQAQLVQRCRTWMSERLQPAGGAAPQ